MKNNIVKGIELVNLIYEGKAPKKIKQGTVYFNYKKEEENIGYRYYQQGTYWILDLMKKLNDEFEIIEKPKVWKPKVNEDYWIIDISTEFEVVPYINSEDSIDNNYYEIGNCFKTREEAEKTIKKLKIYMQLKRYAEEHNTEKIEWNDENRAKYFIKLYHNKWIFDAVYSTRVMHQVYFTSKELCKQAIEEIGEDNIKKLFEE